MKIQITTPKNITFIRDEVATAERGENIWKNETSGDLEFTTRMFWDFGMIVEQGANVDRLVDDAVMFYRVCDREKTSAFEAADGDLFYITVRP